MKLTHIAALLGTAVWFGLASSPDVAAQARSGRAGTVQGARAGTPPAPAPAVADDPFSGPVVTNAPFSADAITTVTQVLGDGTRIEQTTTARFYRDSAGRVRREQNILGLDALNPSGEPRTAITVDPDPGDAFAYTLDPASRTARRVPRSMSSSGAPVLWLAYDSEARATATRAYALTLDPVLAGTGDLFSLRMRNQAATDAQGAAQPEELLGSRQIEGVAAAGRRTKRVIPTGQIGNDRPIEITGERWESPELRLLVRSHHHDPRTGDVEYRLTNIVRTEPPADLFQVPADYTIAGEGAGTPGVRIGGAGPRSGGGGQ